jgi:hypothetical protein
MMKLLELDYKIEYKKGKENVVADALSRQFQVDDKDDTSHYSCQQWTASHYLRQFLHG